MTNSTDNDDLSINELQVAFGVGRSRAVALARFELDGVKVKGRWRVPRAAVDRKLASSSWPPGAGRKLDAVYILRGHCRLPTGAEHPFFLSRRWILLRYGQTHLFTTDGARDHENHLSNLAAATISAAYRRDWKRFDALYEDLYDAWARFEADCGPFVELTGEMVTRWARIDRTPQPNSSRSLLN